jgi:hypothetical protein
VGVIPLPTVFNLKRESKMTTQQNGVDAKPQASDATNQDTIVTAFLTAEAEWNRDQITTSTRDVEDAINALHGHLVYSKLHQTWKYIAKSDGSAYKSWKPFVTDTLGDSVKNWSPVGRNAFIRILLDENFGVAEVAELTGSSNSTVSRVGNGESVGERKPAASGPKQSRSEADRVAEALERFVGKVTDVDKISTADLSKTLKKLEGMTLVLKAEHDKRRKVISAAEGQQPRAGVTAPSPASVPRKSASAKAA